MIDKTGNMAHQNAASFSRAQARAVPSGKVLKMVRNERMGGLVPAWVRPESETDVIQKTLSSAQSGKMTGVETAMAYTPPAQSDGPQEFGFSDLVDMINPLQHIPVVSQIYRAVTGDSIRPSSRLMGGALFGGPLGVASGLVNLVSVQETGQDVEHYALDLVTGGVAGGERNGSVGGETLAPASDDRETGHRLAEKESVSVKTPPEPTRTSGIADGLTTGFSDLPVSLLAFTAPSYDTGIVIERRDSGLAGTEHARPDTDMGRT